MMQASDTKSQPRSETLSVRATQEEKRIVENLAAAKGTTIDALLRGQVVRLVAEYERLRALFTTQDGGGK